MATASYGSQGSSGGGGGGGSGTVTSVASADGTVAITNPTTTPDLSVRPLTVANETALAALAGATINVGTRVWVDTFKCGFTKTLGAAAMAAAAHVRVAVSGAAGYFWVRDDVSPAWWSQLTWEVNPSTGTSEGDGTLAAPLDTFAELGRRTQRRNLPSGSTNSYTVNLRGASPADTDTFQVHLDPNNSINNINITLSGTNALVVVPCGVIASAVAINRATSTPNTITVTGFDFSPYVGKVMRLVGTATTTAVVEKAPSLGVAELAEQSVNNTLGAGFTAGQTVEFTTKLRVPAANAVGSGVTLIFTDLELGSSSGLFTCQNMGPGTINWNRCEVPRGFLVNCSGSLTVNGCGLSGACVVSRAPFSPSYGALINGSIGNLENSHTRHIWTNWGIRNSTIDSVENSYVFLSGNFHCIDLAADKSGITLRGGGQCFFGSGAIWGGGNNATSTLIHLTYSCRVNVSSYASITCDAGLGVSYGSFGAPSTATNFPVYEAHLDIAGNYYGLATSGGLSTAIEPLMAGTLASGWSFRKFTDIASGGTVSVPSNGSASGNFGDITGSTAINYMTIWPGGAQPIITLRFPAGTTINHNTGGPPGGTANFNLAGGVNYVAGAGAKLTVYYDGGLGQWVESGRST